MSLTRRNFLQTGGAAAVAAVGVPTVGVASKRSSDTVWTRVDSPTTKTLYGVVDTVEGPFAVGAGGDVLARRKSGWQTVVDYGPQARSRPLRAVDVTSDGKAIWFVGGSGVIGEYNVVTETLTNYSAPKGKTSTWEGCSVVGKAGANERLFFVNGSGELLVGTRRKNGAIKYEKVTKPGGGSTIPAIDFHGRTAGHVCSTSQFVAETTDGGTNWKRIGIDFAGEGFFDIASVGPKDVNVAAGNGIVYRYDGFRWTPHVIDDGRQAIRALDRDGAKGLAAGSGGKVYERRSAGQWNRLQTPVKAKLKGVARGKTHDVAVGAGGTIVERTVERSSSTLADGNKSVKRYVEGTVEMAVE
ncbi:twin-arginine translocation signal domain-containing protein [Halococcus sp. IIIV-5B]|uniref:WD40/YVTN/BNR-like repeat-containing protein n=1 Tax=Halococcus sp. IIIV-5B TaxID=2321230 RepID=UPI000E7427CD|nr:twin-arginine translocation signal domain-containing protein [Halococcus sp. IIIV-5B]RJT06821.1 twin-arginine translocation signal domain-containing protein [Halococcus sp. IIIV-5B]